MGNVESFLRFPETLNCHKTRITSSLTMKKHWNILLLLQHRRTNFELKVNWIPFSLSFSYRKFISSKIRVQYKIIVYELNTIAHPPTTPPLSFSLSLVCISTLIVRLLCNTPTCVWICVTVSLSSSSFPVHAINKMTISSFSFKDRGNTIIMYVNLIECNSLVCSRRWKYFLHPLCSPSSCPLHAPIEWFSLQTQMTAPSTEIQ